MNDADLIKIFTDNINSLKNNSISKEDLLTNPDVTKALELANTAVLGNELKKRNENLKIKNMQESNIQNGKKINMGCPWTLEFRHKLVTQFNNGIHIKKIADDIERTVGSIEYQLVKEGLIKEEDTTYNKNKLTKSSNQSNNFSRPVPKTNLTTDVVNSSNYIDEDYPF